MAEFKYEVIGKIQDNSNTFITNYLLKEVNDSYKHGWIGDTKKFEEFNLDRLKMVKFLARNENEVGVRSSVETQGYVPVELKLIKNHIYIRTDRNETPADNLGSLPGFELKP